MRPTGRAGWSQGKPFRRSSRGEAGDRWHRKLPASGLGAVLVMARLRARMCARAAGSLHTAARRLRSALPAVGRGRWAQEWRCPLSSLLKGNPLRTVCFQHFPMATPKGLLSPGERPPRTFRSSWLLLRSTKRGGGRGAETHSQGCSASCPDYCIFIYFSLGNELVLIILQLHPFRDSYHFTLTIRAPLKEGPEATWGGGL